MKPCIGIVQRNGASLLQVTSCGLFGVLRHPDCEVINDPCRTLTIERNQHLVGTEADDSQRLILVDHREAEHLLVKSDRSLQIGDLNADMVDVRALEIELFLSGSRCSTGGEQRKASN